MLTSRVTRLSCGDLLQRRDERRRRARRRHRRLMGRNRRRRSRRLRTIRMDDEGGGKRRRRLLLEWRHIRGHLDFGPQSCGLAACVVRLARIGVGGGGTLLTAIGIPIVAAVSSLGTIAILLAALLRRRRLSAENASEVLIEALIGIDVNLGARR